MIEWVVGHLGKHGVDEAVLSLGYKPDAFIAAFPDETCEGVRLIYAVETEPLDTAGAIRFAAREAGIDDTFIVVNGDVLTDLDVESLVRFHRAAGAEAQGGHDLLRSGGAETLATSLGSRSKSSRRAAA